MLWTWELRKSKVDDVQVIDVVNVYTVRIKLVLKLQRNEEMKVVSRTNRSCIYQVLYLVNRYFSSVLPPVPLPAP